MSEKGKMHVGHIIEDVFWKSGMTITQFAKLIACSRSNVYSIFERSDISLELLIKISVALKHNFLEDVSNAYGFKPSTSSLQINVQFDPNKQDSALTKLIDLLYNLEDVTSCE